METLLLIETKDLNKVRDILLKDEAVSRASLTFKEAKSLNEKEGYYCLVSGSEEQCKRALELVKIKPEEGGETIELAKEVEDKEGEEVVKKIKEEEDKAMEGFGGIFG